MNKGRTVFTAVLLPFLILMVFSAEGYGQQGSSAPKAPGAEKPAAPAPRNRSALAGLEVIPDLSVAPPTYTGPCPTTFTFKGKITVNRAATINYRFVRSDNTRTVPTGLTFEKAGTQEVTDTWQFDDATQFPKIIGWEAIQILWPVRIQSNTAFFNGTCTERKPPSPGAAPAPQKPSEGSLPGGIPKPTDPQKPPVK